MTGDLVYRKFKLLFPWYDQIVFWKENRGTNHQITVRLVSGIELIFDYHKDGVWCLQTKAFHQHIKKEATHE